MHDLIWQITLSGLASAAWLLLGTAGWPALRRHYLSAEQRLEQVLSHDLLLGISGRSAMVAIVVVVAFFAAAGAAVGESVLGGAVGAAIGAVLPYVVIRHLEQKRKQRLESQLIDGISTLSSGVRAGLTLVQCFELLVRNSVGPIRQEFAQLLREYALGLDLNQAMQRTSRRIDSPKYQLLFTAIEMHRQRGGAVASTLDRLAESLRDIQRLEGKLDAITAQGRYQASMMAAMPVVFLVMMGTMIDPDGVKLLFTEPRGRVVLLSAAVLIVFGYVWIRRIMSVQM